MKLEKLFTLGLLSAGIMFTSCQDDEDPVDDGNGGGDNNTPTSITFDGSTTPSIGDVYYQSVDTVLQDSVMMGEGENMAWNFDWLTEYFVDTLSIVDPSTTPGGASFPESDYAFQDGDEEFYFYASNTATGIEADGYAGDMIGDGNSLSLVFDNPMNFTMFPATYGDSFSDDFYMDQTMAISVEIQPGIYADSLRMKREGTVTADVNGWGEVTSPMGSYDAIRIARSENSTDSTWIYVEFAGGWMNVGGEMTSNHGVQFQANEFVLPVVQFDMDSLNTMPVSATFLK